MNIFSKAQNTNPNVVPTPFHLNGGVWSQIGSLLGVLLLVLQLLPVEKFYWIPAVTGLIGWLLKNVFVEPGYLPVAPGSPLPPNPVTVEDLDKQMSALSDLRTRMARKEQL